MDGMWIWAAWVGLICSAIPSFAQDSVRMKPLYLISGPEVLQSGTPTLLAVTTLVDAPVTVYAHVMQGNITLIRADGIFQRGVTGILTLPPISESTVTPGSLVTLAVKGYLLDQVIFTNNATISFNPRNVATFIQTGQSCYQPGERVRIRVVSLQLDNRPYRGGMGISVRDPLGNTVRQWNSEVNHLGIVLTEFNLPQSAPLGEWAIISTVKSLTDEKVFIVENYDCPHFNVLVKTTQEVLIGDDVLGTVTAQYSKGKPVQGTLSVSVTLLSALNSSDQPFNLNQTIEIHGSAQFFFSKDHLPALHEYSSLGRDASGGFIMLITACVTASPSGYKVNKTIQIYLMENRYLLSFYKFPPVLKPSLHFSTELKISRYDRRPLSSMDLKNTVLVKVTEQTSEVDSKSTTMTFPVPKDGNVHIEFNLQDTIEVLFIQATFISYMETMKLYKNVSSPSSSYIQIRPIRSLQNGSSLQIDVESTFPHNELHYVVSSSGQILTAGTKTTSSFSLTPTLSWFPEACIAIYCVLPDGETVSDTVHIPVLQHDSVSVNWHSDQVKPVDQASLTVKSLEPEPQATIPLVGLDIDEPVLNDMGKKCNILVLTSARLLETGQPGGPTMGENVIQGEGTYWRQLLEGRTDTWLCSSTRTGPQVAPPASFTSWRARALLTVAKDFLLSLEVPSFLIRGEEIVLQVNIVNHLNWSLKVKLFLVHNEAFQFVMADTEGMVVVNTQMVTVGSQNSTSVLFPIRPLALGNMTITVEATTANASHILAQTVFVKPEGFAQSYSETLFLELSPMSSNNSRFVSFSIPPDVVQGSQSAHVAVVGDILALSINNFDSLVEIPHSCGEQNMILVAPSVSLLIYLHTVPQDNEALKHQALAHVTEGYIKELSYMRSDGSFSAFGARDSSGSTWLTAFVLKVFLQAQYFIQVDQSVLSKARAWLMACQVPTGEFKEVGKVIHTEMQGALDSKAVGLTAFVVIALLENQTNTDIVPENITLAVKYLENTVSSGVVSNYSLCLIAYALALANSPVCAIALDELSKRADYKDGVMMWRSSGSMETDFRQPLSAQIEMASYVLLTFSKHGNLVEGIALMKWLSKQRQHQGGYGSTQDTVVALQALALYAAFSGANSIDLKLQMVTSNSVTYFYVNSSTYLTKQQQQVDTKDLLINLSMTGKGFALFQLNVFYNLKSEALQKSTSAEAFSLDVKVLDNEMDHNHLQLSICTSLLMSVAVPRTGMVMLEVGILSGFTLLPEAFPMEVLIRKVEMSPGKVSLYLDSLTKTAVCFKLPLTRVYQVAHVQDAMVKVYDYYEPQRQAVRAYNSDVMRNLTSCDFCGTECQLCKAGHLTMPFTSHTMKSTTYSKGCLFIALTVFLFTFY